MPACNRACEGLARLPARPSARSSEAAEAAEGRAAEGRAAEAEHTACSCPAPCPEAQPDPCFWRPAGARPGLCSTIRRGGVRGSLGCGCVPCPWPRRWRRLSARRRSGRRGARGRSPAVGDLSTIPPGGAAAAGDAMDSQLPAAMIAAYSLGGSMPRTSCSLSTILCPRLIHARMHVKRPARRLLPSAVMVLKVSLNRLRGHAEPWRRGAASGKGTAMREAPPRGALCP